MVMNYQLWTGVLGWWSFVIKRDVEKHGEESSNDVTNA